MGNGSRSLDAAISDTCPAEERTVSGGGCDAAPPLSFSSHVSQGLPLAIAGRGIIIFSPRPWLMHGGWPSPINS